MEGFLLLGILIVLSVWLNAKMPAIKGSFGEKQVSYKLNKLDPEKYILLNDLYIPKKDGSTAQIDHILISQKGLFVILFIYKIKRKESCKARSMLRILKVIYQSETIWLK